MNIKYLLIICMMSGSQIKSASSAMTSCFTFFESTEAIKVAILTLVRFNANHKNSVGNNAELQIQQFPEVPQMCGCRFSRIKVITRDKSTKSFLAFRGIECIGKCSKHGNSVVYRCCRAIPFDQQTPGDWSSSIEGTTEDFAHFLLGYELPSDSLQQ